VIYDSALLLADEPSGNLPNLTMYAQMPKATIVNSGVAVVGRHREAYPLAPFFSDIFYIACSNGDNAKVGWEGINIDMFAYQQ
jgi:hypothetical protein